MFIESHPELENHPKTLELQRLLNLDIDQTLGKLHRLWWWATKYAEDGDLSKYGLDRINAVIGLPQGETGLIEAKWLDTNPFLRIHDWWHYAGRYFKLKYRNQPDKLIRIESVCTALPKSRRSRAKDTLKTRLSAPPVLSFPASPAFPAFPAKEKSAHVKMGGEKKTAGHAKDCTCEVCFVKAVGAGVRVP